jgi:hypothetical protein
VASLPLKLRSIIGGLTLALAVHACTRINIPFGVTIRAPDDREVLGIGQSFRVVADSDLDQPADQVTRFELQLWDPATGYAMTWQTEISSDDGSRVLDGSFVVPADAPPGEDYWFTVSVLPNVGGSDEPRYAFSDTIRVKISALP